MDEDETQSGIVLASAFKVAAEKTNSGILDALSVFLTLACGAYAGLAFGVVHLLLERVKTKRLWLALAIAMPIGLVLGYVSFEGSRELSKAIRQIAAIESND
jgi:predicted PurR-regulated permease PerM